MDAHSYVELEHKTSKLNESCVFQKEVVPLPMMDSCFLLVPLSFIYT